MSDAKKFATSTEPKMFQIPPSASLFAYTFGATESFRHTRRCVNCNNNSSNNQKNGTALFKLEMEKNHKETTTITSDWPLSFIISSNNKLEKIMRLANERRRRTRKKRSDNQTNPLFFLVVDDFRHAGHKLKESATW